MSIRDLDAYGKFRTVLNALALELEPSVHADVVKHFYELQQAADSDLDALLAALAGLRDKWRKECGRWPLGLVNNPADELSAILPDRGAAALARVKAQAALEEAKWWRYLVQMHEDSYFAVEGDKRIAELATLAREGAK